MIRISLSSAVMALILNAVFSKKPIMMFNNMPFSGETIPAMHETYERLMLAAKELRDVTMPAAVARLLNTSQQVLKNWEKRGLSEGGALVAQRIIGCDANWLLGTTQQMDLQAWKPASESTATSAGRNVAEFQPDRWPFTTFTAQEFNTLLDEEKRTQFEDQILGSITRARQQRDKLSKYG